MTTYIRFVLKKKPYDFILFEPRSNKNLCLVYDKADLTYASTHVWVCMEQNNISIDNIVPRTMFV